MLPDPNNPQQSAGIFGLLITDLTTFWQAQLSTQKIRFTPPHLAGYDSSAHGHLAVAQAVTLGAADVGIATRGAAQAHGLRFLPLSEERFDLVLPGEALDEASIGRLIETLRSRSFRRELGALIGYGVARSGDVEMLS